MDIVFIGTANFAVPSLKLLKENDISVAAVYTQPSRPRGRGKKIKPTPVAIASQQLDLPVFPVADINEDSVVSAIEELQPDLIIVIAFGQKISPSLLAIPKIGAVNLHASLLPQLRGANPIQRAILNGAEYTGVTTMLMDADWDTGPILMQKRVEIGNQTFGQLSEVLAQEGAMLLMDTLKGLQQNALKQLPQRKEDASPAPKLKKMEFYIDWRKNAQDIARMIRALNPVPTARTRLRDTELKIWAGEATEISQRGRIGEIMVADPKVGLFVQTGKGHLSILEIQRPGKNKMAIQNFLLGFDIKPGHILEGDR